MLRFAALFSLLSATTPISSANRIPKTIIQTSKFDSIDRLDWIEYHNSLKKANPNFELVHYDDAEARSFIAEHYGGTILEQAYDSVTPIMRADLFRLAVIYKLGGFYMDMDMLGKTSFDPIVDAIDNGEYGAVFPKEWWMNAQFYRNIFPGKEPQDPEDHWQMGQYAFAAVPEHPFVKDALEEAIVRSVNLMKQKGDNVDDIRDVDILAATGPYLITELYHTGRKEGRYTDVLHLQGDSFEPVLEHRHGGPDWHKFGEYAEHMLSHTWTKPDRRNLQTYSEYGVDDQEYGVTADDQEYGVTASSPTPEDASVEIKSGAIANSAYCLTVVAGVSSLLALVYV
jgi:mannosyltransferase OCH1-like enzyme